MSSLNDLMKRVASHVKSVVANSDAESEHLLKLVGKYVGLESTVLDVGCGYGRNLKLLRDAGYKHVEGVEINPEIVASNRELGLSCSTIEEFGQSVQLFDMILMSHVIEHLAPVELKSFIDGYLDRLAPGGYLIIVTPLMSKYFYDDFDHIKPYQPIGILLVFGINKAQVQFYSRNKLVLKDLWFRKSYYRMSYFRSNYMYTPATRVLHAITLISALMFLLTNRFLGKKDGWIGVFQKVDVI